MSVNWIAKINWISNFVPPGSNLNVKVFQFFKTACDSAVFKHYISFSMSVSKGNVCLSLWLLDQQIHVCEQAEILLCRRHQIRNEETDDPHVPVHTPGNHIHHRCALSRRMTQDVSSPPDGTDKLFMQTDGWCVRLSGDCDCKHAFSPIQIVIMLWFWTSCTLITWTTRCASAGKTRITDEALF